MDRANVRLTQSYYKVPQSYETNKTRHLDSLGKLGSRGVRKVGCERSIDVRPKSAQVNFDYLIVGSTFISAKVFLERVRCRGDT